jgi:hypothetical protein
MGKTEAYKANLHTDARLQRDSSQDIGQWKELVNTVKNLLGPTECRKLFIS